MAGVAKNLMVRVGADFSQIFGEFKKARKEAKDTFADIGNAGKGSKGLGSALKSISKDAASELKEVETKMAQLTAYSSRLGVALRQTFKGSEENMALRKEIESVDKTLAQLGARATVLKVQADTEELRQADDDLGNFEDEEEEAEKKTFSLANALRHAASGAAKFAKGGLGVIKTALSPVTNGVKSLTGGLTRMAKTYLGFGLITSVLGRLKSVVSETISQNAGLKAQVDSLKASMGAALAPAINLVTNALSALMPYVVGVSNAIGNLISNLFGSGWTTATEGANAAAAATSGAAKAQAEYNKQLMGFDEINKISDDKSSESGGGGGGSAGNTQPVEGKMPAWIGSIAQSIRDSIAADDWSILGTEIATQLEGVFQKAHEWMTSVDFGAVGRGIAQGINGAINVFKAEGSVGLGTLLADYLNAGIHLITEGSKTLDWGGLGQLIVKEVGDLLTNLDWSGLAEGLGSLTAGIVTMIGQPIVDGIRNIGDYFSSEIEEAGGNIWLGIGNGIVKGLTNIGSWLKDNILVPFLSGFKETFGIHSPASNPELLDAAGNVALGILEGIAAPFKAAAAWVKTNILDKIQAAINGGNKPTVTAAITNNATTLYNTLKGWWGTRSVSVSAALSTAKATVTGWWTKVKGWWDKTKGSKKLSSVSADLANTSGTWWKNAAAWWNKAKGTLSTIKVNAAKGTGWANMSSWLGGLQKYIGLSVTWKNPSGWIEEAISKYIFNSSGIPSLKFAARGGVVDGATLFGNTVVGEAGPEMIMPLKNNVAYLDILANQIANALEARGGSNQSINVNVTLDGRVVGQAAVKYINGQAIQTGRNPLAAYM